MDALLKKFNYKGQSPVLVIDAPHEAKALLASFPCPVHNVPEQAEYGFILSFSETKARAKELAKLTAHILKHDGGLWLAYPKGSSKKYQADYNRNDLWDLFNESDFRPVRQIAIDENWSAMRFRHSSLVKN